MLQFVQVGVQVFHRQLMVNGVEATRDMANRSSIIRIRKRDRFTYSNFSEGDLLLHVRANQAYFLGASLQ
jgi:hypothetical protein